MKFPMATFGTAALFYDIFDFQSAPPVPQFSTQSQTNIKYQFNDPDNPRVNVLYIFVIFNFSHPRFDLVSKTES